MYHVITNRPCVFSEWQEWREYYAVHLLNRHRDYLAKDGIGEFDEDNIKTYNGTFGVMARELMAEAEKMMGGV